MACQVERVRVGIPGAPHRIDRAPLDLDGLEQAFLDRDRRAGERRGEDHVETLEPALHLAEELRARQQGAAHILGRRVLAAFHLGEQRRTDAIAPLRQDILEAGVPHGGGVGEPHRLDGLGIVLHDLDGGAQRGEDTCRLLAGGAHLAVDHRVAEEGAPGYARTRERGSGLDRCDEAGGRHAVGEGIARMLPGHRLEHQRRIQHGTGHGVDGRDVGVDLRRHVVRDDARRLLQAHDAIARRRDARRTARVGADADRGDTRGECHARAAG